MIILAIEWSSALGSVALLKNEETLGEKMISSGSMPAAALLVDGTSALIREQDVAWDAVDLIVAGCGPGRYSGIRMAVTLAQGLALPGKTPCRVVSSGTALAYAVAAAYPDQTHFVVIGDARRQQIWYRVYVRDGAELCAPTDWSLSTQSAWIHQCPSRAVIVSPDHSRLATLFEELSRAGCTIVEGDPSPSAKWVGRLAGRRMATQESFRPLVPLYLHPAVAQRAKADRQRLYHNSKKG